jgi:hypothetical protein
VSDNELTDSAGTHAFLIPLSFFVPRRYYNDTYHGLTIATQIPSGCGGDGCSVGGTIARNFDVNIVSIATERCRVGDPSLLDVHNSLTNADHAWKVLDGEIGKTFADKIRVKGLRVADSAFAGTRGLMIRNKPVCNVAIWHK